MKRNPATDEYLIQPELRLSLHGTEFPLEYLYRGLLAVGQPGSGKTRCVLMPLLREILRVTGTDDANKAGFLIADPKNELASFILEAARQVGREEDVVVFKPGSAFYNPLSSPFLTETEVVEKIISWANNTNRNSSSRPRGDEMFWANAQRSLLSALVATAKAIHGALDFEKLNKTMERLNTYRNIGEADKWLLDYPVPDSARKGLADYLALPANETRPCVQSSVSNTLYFWRHEPLAQLIKPSATLPAIDPFDIIHQGRILVIGCSGAAYGASITPLLLALKEHFFTALLSRDQIDVSHEDLWEPINQIRPFFVIADEFQSYVSPDPSAGELVALDRLRGFRAGYIAATQNLASIHSVLGDAAHASRLISLFANQVYLSNICPYTAQQAGQILGTKRTKERQREYHPRMAAPLIFGTPRTKSHDRAEAGVEVTRTEPRVSSTTLARMKTGEFWLRLANGKVHQCRSKV